MIIDAISKTLHISIEMFLICFSWFLAIRKPVVHTNETKTNIREDKFTTPSITVALSVNLLITFTSAWNICLWLNDEFQIDRWDPVRLRDILGVKSGELVIITIWRFEAWCYVSMAYYSIRVPGWVLKDLNLIIASGSVATNPIQLHN